MHNGEVHSHHCRIEIFRVDCENSCIVPCSRLPLEAEGNGSIIIVIGFECEKLLFESHPSLKNFPHRDRIIRCSHCRLSRNDSAPEIGDDRNLDFITIWFLPSVVVWLKKFFHFVSILEFNKRFRSLWNLRFPFLAEQRKCGQTP